MRCLRSNRELRKRKFPEVVKENIPNTRLSVVCPTGGSPVALVGVV